MNHVLKHIKWHPKVKIIFLVKLALIDVTSAFESWASTLQLCGISNHPAARSLLKQLPQGMSGRPLRHLSSVFSPKEFLAHSVVPGILKDKGIAFGPCTRVDIFLYIFLVIRGRNSGIRSHLLSQHKSKMELGKKKGSEEQRAQRRWGRF